MSAKKAWRLGAWGALATSGAMVSVGACSSNRDVGDAGTSSTSNTSTTATSSSSGTSSSAPTDSGGSGGLCSLPNPPASNGMGTLYTGGVAAPGCPTTIAYPNNSWFGYFDSTTAGTNDAAAFNFTDKGELNGCDGPTDCAFHTTGTAIPGYGAGVGFTLNNNSAFDASPYKGFQVWLKGTTTGTRGLNFSLSPNTVHVKFVTTLDDGGDPRDGDDYGAYCPTTSADGATGDWVVCTLPFNGLTRDGFRSVEAGAPDPATDQFTGSDMIHGPTNLDKIQFEISSFTPPVDAADQSSSVTFDVWIDDAAFF
jgi:hypothetical protein